MTKQVYGSTDGHVVLRAGRRYLLWHACAGATLTIATARPRIEAILAGTDRVVRVVAKQAHRSLQVLEQGLGKGAAFSLQALEQGLGKGAAFSLQTLEQIGRGAQLSWQRINPVALYQLMQNRATLLRPHVTQASGPPWGVSMGCWDGTGDSLDVSVGVTGCPHTPTCRRLCRGISPYPLPIARTL